jgi:outer membrane protein insertion porin family
LVDVTLTLKEQNRNQLTFGAGVSQYEGVFGQLAFQTANFLGRGESLTVSVQAGDRAQNYQLAFTEPFLFDRNITGGFDVYKRALQYIGYYTQKSTGGNLTFGFPVADFSRMFINYAYEQVRMTDLNEAFLDSSCILSDDGCSTISLDDLSGVSAEALESLRRNPFVFDSLLIGEGGRRTVSKVIPTFVHNTVDNPIFPNTGQRLSLSVDLAMLGGNTQFYKPSIEGIKFFRHTSRTSIGFRGQAQFIAPVRDTKTLPIFEKLFMGGEYTVRGFDIRSIGPSDPTTGLVLGGNKSLLFNGEYMVSIVSQVRLIFFYDAGQVADEHQSFALDRFRTSTGAEVRFFMPVLNVPFRLIFAANPQREGVLDNSFRPAKDFVFRFAVGSTF